MSSEKTVAKFDAFELVVRYADRDMFVIMHYLWFYGGFMCINQLINYIFIQRIFS